MTEQDFLTAKTAILTGERTKKGVGTLGERTLHAILKNAYEPHPDNHEIKVGGFVADIVGEAGIVEIQTRGFDKLRKKLAAFLEVCDVTVVYPIAAVKWLLWVDPETGAVTPRRKSPRKGRVQDMFFELYKIKNFLPHPRFHLRVILLEIEEYRLQNGWGRNGKRGSERCERIPITFLEEFSFPAPAAYGSLLPATLPEFFTSEDYHKAAKIPLRDAQIALNILRHLNVIAADGKEGRKIRYRRASCSESNYVDNF